MPRNITLPPRKLTPGFKKMKTTTILFDLDGTLLPMDQDDTWPHGDFDGLMDFIQNLF